MFELIVVWGRIIKEKEILIVHILYAYLWKMLVSSIEKGPSWTMNMKSKDSIWICLFMRNNGKFNT
jgi:hypothetical protein